MTKMHQTKAIMEWRARVDNWIKIYGREEYASEGHCDLTKIVAVKLCAKCNKSKDKMQRHHIGSEMAFAKILPDYYARRYVSFLTEDIAWLCTKHHKNAHILYRPLISPVYEYVKVCQIRREIPNPHHLELMRQQIRKAFEKWIARKPYTKKKKNARVEWKQSSDYSGSRSGSKSRRNNHTGHGKGKSRSRDS